MVRAHCLNKQSSGSGFTLIELIFVLSIAGFIIGIFMYHPGRDGIAKRTACLNNLKQMGIGFRLYANDNNGRFPVQISTNNGGSMEFTNNTGQAWRHFWAAGDELSNPRILVCPSDNTPDKGYPIDFLSSGDNKYLSYFIGISSQPGNTNQIFLGDADIHLDDNLMPKATDFPLSTNYSWGKRHKGGRGNIALTNGSVTTTIDRKFVDAVKREHETMQNN